MERELWWARLYRLRYHSGRREQDGTAKIVVRHVPPAQPQIQIPLKWMEAPVADAANNWVEASKTDNGRYLAEIGKRRLTWRWL
jgi:hypothetical protein